MKSRAAVGLALCLVSLPAFGQGQTIPGEPGSIFNGAINSAPPMVTGFGTLAGASASTAMATLTVGPNSPSWPLSPAQVYVINPAASAAVGYVCPLAGTCSSSVGIPISPGSWYGFYRPASGMTVYQATGSSLYAQW